MEDSSQIGELYSYHKNGIEEILSQRQLMNYFSQSGMEGIDFESWLKSCCQTKDLVRILPLEHPTKFGSLIAKRREEIGMSEEQLAKICLMSPEELSWIEAGILKPDKNSLQWISNALGIYRSKLLIGQIQRKPDYGECVKNIEGLQEELLFEKECLWGQSKI